MQRVPLLELEVAELLVLSAELLPAEDYTLLFRRNALRLVPGQRDSEGIYYGNEMLFTMG